MSKLTGCPSSEQLRQLVLSQLDPAESAEVQRHVDQCDLCCQTFNVLQNPDADTSADSAARLVPGDLIPPPVAEITAPSMNLKTPSLDFLAPPLESGDLGSLGTYRVLDVLGVGGMGIVLLAEDPKLKRQLALKVVKPEMAAHPEARARFLREAQAVAAIEHDHIVSIYQVSDEAVPFLAMPLLKGQTLADRIRSAEPLSISESLRIAREIALGLAAAHERGVIHRDIKPANVWLEQGSDRVKLLDFGLARPTDGNSELTTTGTIAGTPLYMAPEQIDAQDIDARADLYSLGCVLYRLLTGRPPFSASTPLALLSAVATQHPKPPSSVALSPGHRIPEELSQLVMQLLEKTANDRPASASAVADEIARIESANSTQAKPETANESGSGQTHRSRTRTLALMLGTIGIALAVIIIQIKNKDGSKTTVTVDGSDAESLSVKQNGKTLADVKIDRDDDQPVPGTPIGDVVHNDVEIKIGPRVTVPIKPITIEPDPLPFKQNQPLVKHALVAQPAPIDGVISWTIHSKNHRTTTPWSVVSPDGKYIASASVDLAIRIWEVETGRLVKLLLGHESTTPAFYGRPLSISVCWSPDGKYLASTSGKGSLIFWDFASGRLLRQLACPVTYPHAMRWSPDGTRIVVTGNSPAHEGAVMDVEEGRIAYSISAVSAAWSPNAKTLALGEASGRVLYLEAASGKVVRSFRAHAGPVNRIGFTPDGRTLGTGTFTLDHQYKVAGPETALWHITAENRLRRWEGRYFVAFSMDGTKLMTGSGKELVQTWKTTSGEPLTDLRLNGEVPGAAWLPDGNRVMMRNRLGAAPAIWDDTTGELIRTFGQGRDWSALSNQFRFSPDGQRLLYGFVGAGTNGTVLWELRPLRTAKLDTLHQTVWSPDSSMFAAEDTTLKSHIYDSATGELRRVLSDSRGKARRTTFSVAFAPDGRRISRLNSGNDITIVELASGRTLQSMVVDNPPLHAAWRPNGDQIATIDADGLVQIRDLVSGQVARQLLTTHQRLPRLSWSRDGKRLAAVDVHGGFTVWNVDSDENTQQKGIGFLTWMNHGSQYATHTGGNLLIQDAATGDQIRQLSNLPAGNISPDGRLYVGSELNTNIFFSGENGTLLGKVHALNAGEWRHAAPEVKFMAISPTGHYSSPTIGTEHLIIYVVQTAEGQETLTAEQFADKYGWRNDPANARILGPTDSTPP